MDPNCERTHEWRGNITGHHKPGVLSRENNTVAATGPTTPGTGGSGDGLGRIYCAISRCPSWAPIRLSLEFDFCIFLEAHFVFHVLLGLLGVETRINKTE